jgi:hypothetical protein
MGIVVAMLSVTGVYVWLKKRKARRKYELQSTMQWRSALSGSKS